MDSYNEGLRIVLDLLTELANEHDRTTRDAIADLEIIQAGREEG